MYDLREEEGGMKMRCIRLGGILEVPHDMPLSEIVDKVIDFVEACGWTYCGALTDLKGDPDCDDVEVW